MIITANSDYTTITLQSDYIKDFTGVDSVTLTAKINCGTTEYTDTIVEGDVTLATGTFTLDISETFGTTTLADGVYSFTLEVDSSGSIQPDNGCLFVDNETKCDVAACVKNTENLQLQLDYWIVSRAGAGGCECACDDLCEVYKRITNELSTSCKGCGTTS